MDELEKMTMKLSTTEKRNLVDKTNIFIDNMTINELILVNRVVVEEIKYLQKATALCEMAKYRISEIVSFNNGSELITGRIIKFNQKTVSILTDSNVQWNVAPKLLMRKVN